MKYSVILLDADNTIFDFDACEKNALTSAFKELNFKNTEELLDAYHEINIKYWAMLAEKKIEKEKLYWARFSELFSLFNIDGDPVKTNALYRKYLHKQHVLYNGATNFLQELSLSYKLYMVTNGDTLTQKLRLADSKIDRYLSGVFISDEIGYEKPERGFFDYVANNIPNFSKSNCLLIGDGLKTDIKGAVDYQIDCVWFNPLNLPCDPSIVPTYRADSYNDIIALLKDIS